MESNRKRTKKEKVLYLNQFDIPYFLEALKAYEREIMTQALFKNVPFGGYGYAIEWVTKKRKELNGNKTNTSSSNLQPVS